MSLGRVEGMCDGFHWYLFQVVENAAKSKSAVHNQECSKGLPMGQLGFCANDGLCWLCCCFLLQSLPFPTTAKGALETDPTLQVHSHARVFALGDVSGQVGAQGDAAAATAQVAFQQADYAAWNVWSAVNGRPLLPFR